SSFSTARTITPAFTGGTISVDGTRTLTVNGALGAGGSTLGVNGAGTLVLNAASARSGPTTITNGTVRLNHGGALGSGNVDVSNGGTLELGPGAIRGGAITLQSLGGLRSIGTGAVLSGPITVQTGGAQVTLASSIGVLVGTLDLFDYENGGGSTTHVTGTGEVTLSGPNSYAGAWSVESGTLRLTHADAISSSASPIVVNPGATVSAETASNYAGDWIIGGELQLQHATAAGIGVSPLAVDATGSLQLANAILARDVALSSGAALTGIGSSGVTATVAAASAAPLLSLATGGDPDDTLTLSSYTGGSGSTTHVSGAGEVILSQANPYAGNWEVAAGRLRVDNAGALGGNSTPVVVGSGGTLHLHDTTLTRSITLGDGATLEGSYDATVPESHGILSITPGADVTFKTIGVPTGLVIGDGANDLTGGGSGSTITVAPGSTVTLNSPSNYVGDWTVHGTLFANNDSDFGDLGNAITLDNGALVTFANFTSSRPFDIAGTSALQAFGGSITLDTGLTGTFNTLEIGGNGPVILNAAGSLSGNAVEVFSTLELNDDLAAGSVFLRVYGGGVVALGTGVTLTQAVMFFGETTLRGNDNSAYLGAIGVNDTSNDDLTLATVAPTDVFTLGYIAGGGPGSTITADGPGTMVLTSNSTYSGNWFVTHGVLQISNTIGSATGSGTVIVSSGATLDGTGSIAASNDVLNDGTVAPGTSVGTLTVHRYTAATGALNIEIGGLTPGVEHDQLVVNGEATLAGTLNLQLVDDFQPQAGDSFVIITCGMRNGTFDQVTGLSAGPGLAFQVQYNANDVTVTVGPAVKGDMDGDGDIDLDDYFDFAACMTGPLGTVGAGCENADFDADGDVDLLDAAGFQAAFAN
ncbi:MAG TPA: autotransporter-associated beta strand repeat-containing protein, partial [Phycisphaerae bacterium]|nr:autotransporter-associated beta strand repeat-containing protein [Phycisphaerae bacterium]